MWSADILYKKCHRKVEEEKQNNIIGANEIY